ncbi:TPA: ABC transporter substrate-binding protein, partial [Staphylococcus aureus]|nr:ABC transporter substrate-binding protein [Staphylococcus aureus]
MKRLIGILLCNLFILTACSASVDKTSNSTKTTDYKIENGETLKVPEKPKRVAVLTGFYVGDFIKLGIKPIAVSDITKDSSILKPYLKGVDYIGENDVERVAKAKPDLIVVDSMDKNIKKYQKIAPTIPYTYNKYNHKEILKEIGKLTNNEDKAKKWIEEWDDKTRKDKKEIQSKIGQATASVFEPDEKQ